MSDNETDESAMSKIQPTVVKNWDLKDRTDGVELRVFFKDGSTRKLNFADLEVKELAGELDRIVDSDDRPVREGANVR